MTEILTKLLAEASRAEDEERLLDALRAYRMALNLDSASQGALLGIGRLSLLFERREEALIAFTKVLLKTPTCAEGLRGRGVCFLQMGQGEKAVQDLRVAVKLSPDDLEMHLTLGQALMSQGDWASAQESLEVAIFLDPGDPDVAFELLRCLLQRNLEGAVGSQPLSGLVADYQKYAEVIGEDPALDLIRAGILFLEGKTGEAVQVLEDALEEDPSLWDVLEEHPDLEALLPSK